MKPKYWIFLGVGTLILIVGINVLIANTRFTFKHPRAPNVTFVIGRDDSPHLEVTKEMKQALQHVAERPPSIVVRNGLFNFGEMNPHSTGEHLFEITNDGEGALTLKNAGSTCKCTAAEIKNRIIPPGRSGQVLVRWNTGSTNDLRYAQRITLWTNDPKQPEIQLAVEGRVAHVCAAEPATAYFHSLDPDETGHAQVLVYSPIWESFNVQSIQCSLPQVSWNTRAATAEELSASGAKSGYVLSIYVAASVPVGEFHEVLMATLESNVADSPPLNLSIEVSGTKHGRLAVLGAEVDEFGTVDLGTVTQGEEKTCHLLLRYRGEATAELPVRAETDCPYLKATVLPRPNQHRKGFFDLEIRIAQDAPLCSHMPPHPAQLRLISDDPKIPQMKLDVEFAVIRP